MNDCPNCMAASERDWHQFTTECMVCQARAISRGPACFAAKQKGYITPEYKAELVAVAGVAHWRAVHELVRAWQHGRGIPTFVEVAEPWSH